MEFQIALIKISRLSVALILSLLVFSAQAESDDGPYIVHVSDTPPGYTMVITGGGYDPRTVKVVIHYPGDVIENKEQLPKLINQLATDYSGTPLKLPVTLPESQVQTVKPLHATEYAVFVPFRHFRARRGFLPSSVAKVYLMDKYRLSNPIVVNQPKAWWLLKPTSRPGELNRIYGFNIKASRHLKNHVFMRPASGGGILKLPQIKRHWQDGVSDKYNIQFRIPLGTPSGQYLIFAHSGAGGHYGFTESLPLTVTTEPAFPQRFFNAAEHGVKNDSFTDALPSLQKLVNKAGEHGGGIVYLPPGQYRLNNTLQLRANVILRGAGRENTILFYGGGPAVKTKARWLISAREVDHTGLEDLTIRVSDPLTITVNYFKNDRSPTYNAHIVRCRFEEGEVQIGHSVNMEIGFNLFYRARLHLNSVENGWIHDNEITHGRLRGNPFLIWGSRYTTIEHNRVFGSSRGFVWQQHGKFGHYRNFIDANVVEDTRFGINAGETFLFEGAGFKWWGQPSTVKINGFTVADAAWEPNALRDAFAIVTSGHGLGEYVRIIGNTAKRVILEKPWPVLPSHDAQVSILKGVVENVLTNNREVNADNSMMFYGAGAINNRIERYRSENGLGISVWSRGAAEKNLLIPDYFNIFEGNLLEDQGSFTLRILGDARQNSGIRNLNNIFRRNFISDTRRKGENQYYNTWEKSGIGVHRPIQPAFGVGTVYSKNRGQLQSPLWINTLIERNYMTRMNWGIALHEVSEGAVINRNTFFDVKLPVIDQGKGSWVRKNRFEHSSNAKETKIEK